MSQARTLYSSATTEFYVGHSATRAYFEKQNVIFQPECILYWTDLQALPDGFLENLENKRDEYLKQLENTANTPNQRVELTR